jgi:predicted AAA+ superfamily ATPase
MDHMAIYMSRTGPMKRGSRKGIGADQAGAPRVKAPGGVISAAEVLRVIQRLNPWWSGSVEPVPYRRLAFYECRSLLQHKEMRRAVLLSGARRVGKTTILRQLAADAVAGGRNPESVLYLSLESPALTGLALDRLLRYYHESVCPEGQPALLLLDEVQYCEQWDLHLKQLVDHHPEYRIAATGSAGLEHRRKLAESGVGRWLTVPVPTLSFGEYLGIRGEGPGAVPEGLTPESLFAERPQRLPLVAAPFRRLLPAFRRYLLLGGFPETALADDLAVAQRVLREDVIDKVLKRDVPALFGVRNVADLEKLFVYLCTHTGGIFSATDCANALGSSRPTVLSYLEALREANLVHLLAPFRRTGKKALRAPPKVYLVDAALRNAVLLRGDEVLTDPTDMGQIVETVVLRHLLSRYHPDTPEVTYWRDRRRNREVDFVVRTPKYTIPVEVKYRAVAPAVEGSGLAEFCLSEGVEHAYWVAQRDEDFGLVRPAGTHARVLRIPAHILCCVLGEAERLKWAEG